MTDEQDWTDVELEASVDAYLSMLQEEQAGRKYNKAAVNRQLREGPLKKRNPSSVEFRMQNISAALEELCLPRIKGYLPAKNIGTGVKDRIRVVLSQKGVFEADDYEPTENDGVLSQRVSKLLRGRLKGVPRGIKKPRRVRSEGTSYGRDPLVKAWVLQKADGKCEGCGLPAPFVMDDGSPFLEVHHVRPLAKDGSDQTSNTVALCPNCHRRCHQSKDRASFTDTLYNNIERLVWE